MSGAAARTGRYKGKEIKYIKGEGKWEVVINSNTISAIEKHGR